MEIKEKDGEKWVAIGSEWKGKRWTIVMPYLFPQGARDYRYERLGSDEPSWLLKLPHKTNHKWDYVIALPCIGQWKGTAIANGPEKVEVPAGKFEAIRVKLDIVFAGDRRRITTWYAPGIGKVKEILLDGIGRSASNSSNRLRQARVESWFSVHRTGT